MLSSVLTGEIKKFLGTGNHPEVYERLRETAKSMENINRYNHAGVDGEFTKCLKKHGRAAVAICIASTLWEHRWRLDEWNLSWALDVLNLWTWKHGESHLRACICGNSHPTTICNYSAEFIKLNSD